MKWIDYRESLGLGFSDSDKKEMLANKIRVLFDEISSEELPFEDVICRQYFSFIGERNPGIYYAWYEVKNNILTKQSIPSLISHTIVFSNVSRKSKGEKLGEHVLISLIEFLSDLKIDYEIIEDDDGFFIFPKGAKELDDVNVNIPFEWLRKYPTARKTMEYALRSYANRDKPSQVADSFRKSLEIFFNEFFNNEVTLENQKSKVGQYLKDKGVPAELSGNFETTLQMYTNYMNNYAKHKDRTSDKWLEFIMYQTGNIIRFILTLSSEKLNVIASK